MFPHKTLWQTIENSMDFFITQAFLGGSTLLALRLQSAGADAAALSVHQRLKPFRQALADTLHVVVVVHVLANFLQSRPVLSRRFFPRTHGSHGLLQVANPRQRGAEAPRPSPCASEIYTETSLPV